MWCSVSVIPGSNLCLRGSEEAVWGESRKKCVLKMNLTIAVYHLYNFFVYILVLSCLDVSGPESSCPSFEPVAFPVPVTPKLSPSSALVKAIHLSPVWEEEPKLTHSHSKQWPPSTAVPWWTLASFWGEFWKEFWWLFWSNNLLAGSNRICECALENVLRVELYKMSRWSLLPSLNKWSEPVGTQREICG